MQNTIRYAVFLLIVTGTFLAACDSDVVDPEMELPTAQEVEEETGIEDIYTIEIDVDNPTSNGSSTTPAPSDTNAESSMYEDGTYTASGSYASPAGPESIGVTLTIKDDVVSSVSIQKNATNQASVNYQDVFASGISAQIVGKSLDEIGGYSSINGSSLTPNGFDAALASIKTDAAL